MQSPVDNVFRVKVNRVGRKKRQLSVQFPGLLGGWKDSRYWRDGQMNTTVGDYATLEGAIAHRKYQSTQSGEGRCKSLETFALWVGGLLLQPRL